MTNSPWISVKDRLPDENPIFPNRYLVAKGNIVLESKFAQGKWWGICDSTTERTTELCPTHWMPLPEPPKPKDPFDAWWGEREWCVMQNRNGSCNSVHKDSALAIWNAAIASQKT